MKLRDAVAMLIFWAIYVPLSITLWYVFKLPEMTMILIFLLGIVYVILYLLLAILMTPPNKVIPHRIEPEIIEVQTIPEIQRIEYKKKVKPKKIKKEEIKEILKEETKTEPKPKKKYNKREKEQKIAVPNSKEEEAEQLTAPEELPLPFSSPEDDQEQDLD